MKCNQIGTIRIGLVLILTLGAAAQAWPQEKRKAGPDPAEWAPADAIGFIGVTDTQRAWEDWKKTTVYQALNDKDLAGKGGGKSSPVQRLMERLAKAIDTTPDELKNPFAGPLALFVSAPRGGGSKDLTPGLVAQVGDSTVMQKYFDSAVKHLKNAAGNYETVSAGNHTIHVFTTEPGQGKTGEKEQAGEEEKFGQDMAESGMGGSPVDQAFGQAIDQMFSPENMPAKLAMCLAGERLIVGGTAEQVQGLLSSEKQGETLADTDDYKALLQQLKPIGDVRFMVNLPRVFELAKAEAGEADHTAKVLGALGTGGLRSAIGHMRLGAKSCDLKVEVLFLMRGERSGLAKLLSMENRPVASVAAVPASTAYLVSINASVPRMLDEIVKMVGQADPEAGKSFEAELEQGPLGPDGQPINPRKDLIENLAAPITFAAEITRPYGPGSFKWVVRLGQRSRESIGRVSQVLLAGAKPREVRGAQVFEGQLMGMFPLALAVTSDQVLVAGNAAVLEAALSAGGTETLADDATFKRALRFVPKEAWLVSYSDDRRLIEGLAELAKKPDEMAGDPLLMMMLQMFAGGTSDSSRLQKTLDLSSAGMFTIATTPEGVRVTMVKLKPKEE
jgi:hypothetical protein